MENDYKKHILECYKKKLSVFSMENEILQLKMPSKTTSVEFSIYENNEKLYGMAHHTIKSIMIRLYENPEILAEICIFSAKNSKHLEKLIQIIVQFIYNDFGIENNEKLLFFIENLIKVFFLHGKLYRKYMKRKKKIWKMI